MESEFRPGDFVDYHAIFSEALTRLGKGMSVQEALVSCIRERHPLTHRDINAEARAILNRLTEEREWGVVRSLRELANHPGLAEELRARKGGQDSPGGTGGLRRPDAIADYPRVFLLAQRKRQTGFSLDDSLEMAVRELYPQTYRKVKEAALFYIRLAAQRLQVHELRALRELAEDPLIFSDLENSLPE